MKVYNGNARWIWSLLLALLAYFCLFHRLASNSLFHWDESLFALRALFYSETGQYLSNFNEYEGLLSHRNTKLPFTTLIQAASFRLLGTHVLALRLPILCIVLLGMGFVYLYCKRILKAPLQGIIFGIVLLATPIVIRVHMARSGDQDIAVAMYLIVSYLSFYEMIKPPSGRRVRLWATLFISSTLAAILTKNLLAGVPFLGIVPYLFLRGKVKTVVKLPVFWVSAAIILVGYATVIVVLELQHPGFVDRMLGYELVGRFREVKENTGPWWMYGWVLIRDFNAPVFLLSLLSMGYALRKKFTPELNERVLYLSSIYFSYLIIISFSATKNWWYVAPVIGCQTFMAAVGIVFIIGRASIPKGIRQTLMFLVLLPGMVKCVHYASTQTNGSVHAPVNAYLSTLNRKNKEFAHLSLICDNRGMPCAFYTRVYQKKGLDISMKNPPEVSVGDVTVICDPSIYEHLSVIYEFEERHRSGPCRLLEIKSAR